MKEENGHRPSDEGDDDQIGISAPRQEANRGVYVVPACHRQQGLSNGYCREYRSPLRQGVRLVQRR